MEPYRPFVDDLALGSKTLLESEVPGVGGIPRTATVRHKRNDGCASGENQGIGSARGARFRFADYRPAVCRNAHHLRKKAY